MDNGQTEFLASEIRRIRKEKKISQKTISEGLGIDRSSLAKIELGTVKISANRVFDIAELLGVPVSSLFKTSKEVSDTTIELANKIDSLSDEQQTLIKSMVNSLSNNPNQ
jgi:transcriptional regulator with XRE-family HTH domain|tara:strand:- start:77 stop:406 length:330 start_codon:yes stop_codon:yes gene_type:complete